MAHCEAYIARPRAAPSPALSISSSSSSSSSSTTSGPSRYVRRIDHRLRRKLDAVKRIIEGGEDIARVSRATGFEIGQLRRYTENAHLLRHNQYLAAVYARGPKQRGFKRTIWALPPEIRELRDHWAARRPSIARSIGGSEALAALQLRRDRNVSMRFDNWRTLCGIPLEELKACVAFAVAFANVQRAAPRPGMIDERDSLRRIYFRDVDDARTFIHPRRPWDLRRMKHRHCRRVMELPPMLRRDSAEPGRDALARRG